MFHRPPCWPRFRPWSVVKNDDTVLPHADPVKGPQQLVNVRIDERHVRVVSAEQVPATLTAIDVVPSGLVEVRRQSRVVYK